MTQPSGDVQRAAFGWDAGCEPLVAVTRGGAVESVHRGVATVTDLVCGAHPPASGAARDQLAQRGETASPRHDGCSGKHAGMLTLALFLGAPTVGYERPSYPVQREIAAGVGRALGTEMLGLFSGVDGCVVPVLRVSARQAATLYAPLVAGADRGLARIRDAMMARLELVAGQGFFDTRVMEAAPGVVLAKMGAEGAQGLALLPAAAPRPAAVGCCLKVEDGSERSIPVVAAAFLRVWSESTSAAAEQARIVTSHRGAPVGDRVPLVGESAFRREQPKVGGGGLVGGRGVSGTAPSPPLPDGLRLSGSDREARDVVRFLRSEWPRADEELLGRAYDWHSDVVVIAAKNGRRTAGALRGHLLGGFGDGARAACG